jgi:chlorobactene glucosyltransferase
MIYFFYFINILLLIVLLVTVYNAFTAPILKKGTKPVYFPFVSVLIPARNEEQNITECLKSLMMQNYPNFEIIVLNDESTDLTSVIVNEIMETDYRIQMIQGKPLPPGWTGKNWACHQLSLQACGDVMIFTDADNRFGPEAVSHTVGWIQKLQLSLFSAFPQQITVTLAEKLVVPAIFMTVYCYLPLWLTYYSPFPSLAAANGQWIAFTRYAYEKLNGHSFVRDKIVEDIALCRLAKKKGMKILTASGIGEIWGRMYHNRMEVWEGFSKNVFGILSYKKISFILLLLLMFICYVLPFIVIAFKPFFYPALAAILINIMIRLILSFKYKQPLFTSIFLHPAAIMFSIMIGINSMVNHKKGKILWKDRIVIISDS